MAKLTKLSCFAACVTAVSGTLPAELPLAGRAKGIVDLQAKCLNQNYMRMTSKYESGGCPEYVRGIQAELEWADAEPEHGKYNFSVLQWQIEQIAALGKFAVIKLNGGHKPEWMYGQIPQSREIWSLENFDNTTLMYWHPLFISAYVNLIKAYAEFVQQMDHTHGGLIAYVRMNFNAVGTEHIGIPKGSPESDMSTWFSPVGCVSNCSAVDLPWSKSVDDEYKKRVFDQHVSSFGSQKHLLARASIEQDVDMSDVRPVIEKRGLGFFQTGAAMEEDQVFNQSWRYSQYQEWCLPGTTYGFAEQAGFWQYTAAWPLHPGNRNVGVFSKAQFAYWLMLSNLHNGVSASGLHFDPMMFSPEHADEVDRVPLNDDRYIHAYRFYDTYAGYHAHPDYAPGAWLAFRGKGDNFPSGDYRFLMQSSNTSVAFDSGRAAVGSRYSPEGAWCKALSAGDSANFKVALTGELSSVLLRVVWFDESGTSWKLLYTAGGKLQTAMQQSGVGSHLWASDSVTVEGAEFESSSAKHLVLMSTGSTAVSFHMIEVRRLEPSTLLI